MLLSINNNDYSNKLLNSFAINEYKTYTEWLDTNMKKHKELTRKYVKGKLTLTLNEKEVVKFMQDLESVRSDKTYDIIVYVNNLFTTKAINAYIEFYPEIRKDTTSGKIYHDVSISVEEV